VLLADAAEQAFSHLRHLDPPPIKPSCAGLLHGGIGPAVLVAGSSGLTFQTAAMTPLGATSPSPQRPLIDLHGQDAACLLLLLAVPFLAYSLSLGPLTPAAISPIPWPLWPWPCHTARA